MLYGFVLGLHACAMGAALLLLVANELLLVSARRGARGPAGLAFFISRFSGPLLGLGVLAGFAVVYLGGWSLLTPWLVLSFVLIAAVMTVESKFVRPWAALAQAKLRGAASVADVKALASDNRALAGRMTMIALFAVIIALMTVKPDLNLFA